MQNMIPVNRFNNACATFLNEFSSFELLTDEEKYEVEANSVEVIYKKGENICKQGSFASHIIYLEEGLVKSYLEGSPRDLILTITPSKTLVGLPAIFEGNNTFLYSVSSYVDSRVKLIGINTFKGLLRRNAVFASKIIDILNENTSQGYGRFYCLVMKQLHGRLADILLCLSQKIFKTDIFDLPLSRTDLAELTGMSTESVIRILKDFKDDGLIRMTGKSMQILDIDRLKKISDFG
jgi:CRP/FNR family transcriptional regulator, polysaccharide utilization system transcription regulator